MTKEELFTSLKVGKTMDSLFPFSRGQECLIFKADTFIAGDEIIYIPDTSLNDVPMDRPLEDDDEVRAIIELCYTGADLVEQCGGNVELARSLFSYCDWQHPSSALPEVALDEEKDMSDMKKLQVTIFQAPLAVLVEKGLYWQMHNGIKPFQGPVPAEYYMTVFNGTIDCPAQRLETPDLCRKAELEYVFRVFNFEHPTGYCGRSLSIGDVVRLEGQDYLCAVIGFTPVFFECSKRTSSIPVPPSCEMTLPSGIRLRASTHNGSDYPCMSIELFDASGKTEQICFVEHNPEKAPGRELCIGVYCGGEDEPVYYDSYHLKDTQSE